jgi:hypothetical protein
MFLKGTEMCGFAFHQRIAKIPAAIGTGTSPAPLNLYESFASEVALWNTTTKPYP